MIVGSAEVVIRALGDKLQGDIQKSLDRASIGASKSGEKTGKNFTDGITKGIDSRRTELVEAISKPVERAAATAGDRTGRVIADRAGRSFGRSRALDSQGEAIGRRVGDRVARGFERSRITRVLGSALVKLGIFIPIIGALVGGISALVSGLFAIVAAVGTASSSLVALGGVLTAGIQGIGIFVIAMKGVGKAIGEGFKADNVEKFEEALKKVAPAARPFVREFVKLKPEFVALRNAAAEGLFPGLESSLSRIAPLLPKMRDGFRQAGDAAGDAVAKFTRSVTSANAIENFGTLTRSNNRIFRQFGAILGDVGATLLALFAAATPLTERFVTWIEKGTDSLRRMTEAGTNSGRLTEYFNEAGDVAALLGRILGNVFEGLYEIGQIAQPMGLSLLTSFELATQKLANFTDEADNVTMLRDYFEDVRVNVLAVSNLVGKLGGAFARMGAAPGVKATADALAKIVPDLEEALTKSIEEIGPAIAELIGEILQLFSVLEESGAVESVIKIFTSLAKALVFLFNIPGIGKGLLYLLQFVAVMKALKLITKGGGFIFKGISDGLSQVSTAAGKTTRAVSAVNKNIAGTRFAIGKLGFADYAKQSLIASGAMDRMGNISSPRLQKAFQKTAISAAAMADGMGRAGRPLGALATGMINVGNGASRAAKGIGNFVRSNGRAVGSAALLGAAATGVAGKIGLQNTAMFASVGLMVGGPWGAAIGGGIGALADLRSGYVSTTDAIKDANAAMKSGNFSELTASYDQLIQKQKDLADATTNSGFIDGIKDAGSGLRSWANLDFSNPYSQIGKTADAAQRLRDKLADAKTSADLLKGAIEGVSNASNLEQARDDLAAYLKMFNERKPINLDIRDTGGREAIANLKAFSDAFRTVNGTSQKSLTELSNTLTNKIAKAGFPVDQARTFANALAGVKDQTLGLDGKKITITPEFGALLDGLGDAGKKIRETIEARNAKIDLLYGPGFKDTKKKKEEILSFGEQVTAKINVEPARSKGFFGILKNLAALAPPTVKVPVDADKKPFDLDIKGIVAYKPPKKDIKVDAATDSFYKKWNSLPKSKTATVSIAMGNISATILQLLPFVKKAMGGFVYGAGTGTSDSIPAMLSNGEFVIRAAQAKRFGPLLEAINDGKPLPKQLPNMSSGAGVSGKSSSGRGNSRLSLVSGTVTLTPESRVLLHAAAEEVYDDSASYDDSRRGM